MTILSDKEIRELSVPPIAVLTQNNKSFFSHLTKEGIDEVNLKNVGVYQFEQCTMEVMRNHFYHWRPVTEADLAQWSGMITPYTEGQVRDRCRDMNAEERAFWNDWKRNTLGRPLPDKYIMGSGDDQTMLIKEKIISYGTSSYGYDLRCGHKFKIFSNINAAIVDPKGLDPQSFVDVEVQNDGDYIIVPPNGFALTYSLEHIKMPKDVTGVVLGKSTYARTGLICIATPLEAGWEGYVTLEFANSTPLPMKLYAGEGCCQVLFHRGAVQCEVSYADRNGKYMNQPAEVVLPTV